MAEKISGIMLFLRYAFPCAESKLASGKITEDDYKLLKSIIQNGGCLIPRFLEKFFPKAFDDLRRFAREKGWNMWEYDVVSHFWRYRHKGTGDCGVYPATVVLKETDPAIWARSSLAPKEISPVSLRIPRNSATEHGKEFAGAHMIINAYSLPLKECDTVFFHNRIIAEVL